MTSLILGTFDGVHLAHRELIKSAATECDNVVACTFSTHPLAFFKKDIRLLTLNSEREALLKAYGVDEVYESTFDEAFSKITPEAYIKLLVERFTPSKITVGFNHTFGHMGTGSFKTVSELSHKYGYTANMVLPVKIGGSIVSSTAIRGYLLEGDIDSANAMLGRSYSLSGVVIHGRHLGTTISFPTVNLDVDKCKLLPKNGVYCTYVIIGAKRYKGVTNIGVKPTVTNENALTVETHILGFSEDAYGKRITLELEKRIRDELKFESLDSLRRQLALDTALTDLYLK